MDLLCTTAQVRAYLGIADSSPGAAAADAQLAPLIEAVSAYALNQSNMPDREDGDDPSFFESDYAETYDGTGGTILLLRHGAPTTSVTAVRSVTVDGMPIPKSTGAPTPGFRFDRFSVRLSGYRFTKGDANVVVKYTAGADPTSATGIMLREAGIEWVALIYKTRPHIDVRSKTLDREVVSYFVETMPLRMNAVLANLKNRMAA